MLNAIEDSLSDLASSDDGENGDDEDDHQEDPVGGNLSEDDEPGWVMGTISKTGQSCMQRFRQMQTNFDESTHPGWGDPANYFCERDKRYGMTELKVLAVVQPQTADDAASSVPIS